MKKLIGLAMVMICVFCFCACGLRGDNEKSDISLDDVKNANQFGALMEDYDSISIKEERININGDVYSTVYWDFRMEDGQAAVDTWTEAGEQKAVVNARSGVLYSINGDAMNATIVPAAEYEKRIKDMMPFLPSADEKFVSTQAMDEKEILVETAFENPQDNAAMGGSYYVDADTLQINRVQIAAYDEKGFKTSIRAMNVACDGSGEPDRSALTAVTGSKKDGQCNVTVVINPGSDNEETYTLDVAKGCGIAVSGREAYGLYRDEACQEELPAADTTGGSLTVYAKPLS